LTARGEDDKLPAGAGLKNEQKKGPAVKNSFSRRCSVAGLALFALAVAACPAAALDVDLTGRPAFGPAGAPVQLVEFSDFQCAHCAKMAPILHHVLKEYGNLVRLTVVTINAPGHAYSEPAAELALTAYERGKFTEAYLQLFARQSEFSEEFFPKLAKELGLPEGEVRANITSHKHREVLKANFMLAVKDLGLEATPTLFIGDQRIEGAKNADTYRYYINAALKAKNIPSPVADVPKPEDLAKGRAAAQVPLDLIYPVAQLPPRDSQLKVEVGQLAPDFELPTTMPNTMVRLSSFRGRKNVVLSFVPAAWTPQCSAQWPEYNEYQKELRDLDTEVIGITVDNIPSLYSWTVSMGRPWFTVASDFWPHGEVAKRYGVLRAGGVSERAVFVVDKQGVIRYIDVHDINSRPGIGTLLEELKKLNP
jgi:peroxiredoxin (alkyl hydroperoxide reductase subunit C)